MTVTSLTRGAVPQCKGLSVALELDIISIVGTTNPSFARAAVLENQIGRFENQSPLQVNFIQEIRNLLLARVLRL